MESSPGRRIDTAHRLEANFRSLPNVTCHNFFVNLTRSLIDKSCCDNILTGPSSGAGTSSGSSLSSWRSNSSQNLSATGSSAGSSPSVPAKRLVKVYCQLRELDPKTGKNLARRQLTKVREEDEDDDDNEQASGELEFDLSAETVHDDDGLIGKLKRRSRDDKREQQDFASFMKLQKANSNWSHTTSAAKPKKVDLNNNSAKSNNSDEYRRNNWATIDCFELFCVHNSNLLIHKSQPTIEAQRLARRLANLLCQSNDNTSDSQ